MEFPAIGMKLSGPSESGDLTLVGFIGAGAFGLVFKARDDKGGQYAVKFPQLSALVDGDELQAFLNEVRAASRVRHENVLPVLFVSDGSGETPPYLVLEYADGGTLQDRIDEAGDSQLPMSLVLELSRQLVAGIEAINEVMLHRDLKPDNVLMVGTVLKIADFGLSKLVGEATRSRTFKGAQHTLYMPPEGWMGLRNEIQVDMYAMGILLFQLATLDFPYVLPRYLSDIAQLRDMHLSQVPRRLSSIRPDLPPKYSDIVAKLMEKRPQDRYATWSDVRVALTSLNAATEAPMGKGAALRELIVAVQSKHDDTAKAAAERKTIADKQRLESLADHYSRDKLVELLLGLIQEFNAESQLHKIEVTKRSENQFVIRVPYGRNAELEFFGFPQIKIRDVTVRFGGAVTDDKGCGFNLLLVRTGEEDVYGTWKVCRIVPGAFSRRHLVSGCSSLGLGPDLMEDVRMALTMTHTLSGTLVEDVEGEFLKQLREFTEPMGS